MISYNDRKKISIVTSGIRVDTSNDNPDVLYNCGPDVDRTECVKV